MKIYVNGKVGRDGDGTKERPFRRINDAAKIARPGDEVLVSPGVYREYVDPIYAGTEEARISSGAQNIWEQLLLVRKESSPGRHTRRMSGSAVWRTVFLELTIRIPRWYM